MSNLDKVEHFIVLMQENRSFDHLLGYLRSADYPVNGLDGSQYNALDPNDPGSARYAATMDARDGDPDPDPGHSFNPAAVTQMYGLSKEARQQLDRLPDSQPVNNGFVYDFVQRLDGKPQDAMRCFAPASVPVIATLAQQFAVCDNWFSSVPGATWPNRWFVHAATSNGYLGGMQKATDVTTIYERLLDAGRSCTIYYHDFPQSTTLLRLLRGERFRHLFKPVEWFWSDVAAGRLADYVFIEPRYFDLPGLPANDQHPSHSVRAGEELIAKLYNALRASSLWTRSALVITYDEGGGTYDHVPPAATVSPDGKRGQDDDEDGKVISFDFKRLGFRVPAVVVSPLIPRGTIDSRLQDHTAILALLEQRYGLPHLTERDKWAQANSLGALFSLAEPRSDTPQHLAPALVEDTRLWAGGRAALNEFQLELVESAEAALPHDSHLQALRDTALGSRKQADAAIYLRAVMARATGAG